MRKITVRPPSHICCVSTRYSSATQVRGEKLSPFRHFCFTYCGFFWQEMGIWLIITRHTDKVSSLKSHKTMKINHCKWGEKDSLLFRLFHDHSSQLFFVLQPAILFSASVGPDNHRKEFRDLTELFWFQVNGLVCQGHAEPGRINYGTTAEETQGRKPT